ncbi:C4-dicarboxylate ABC transporter permease [Kushneria pakistanensis]|uniref:TRAP transporter small permease protein n=1 Tax=Kushneria pakistanensis TaxID=1508770 RepID=A0ABQ3FPC5_9GAMM|nr:TRAP transporter small permease [Kushneria pakistanensis]GHC32719.1 C4-dicarboxylate ABC transporter permease [Kushneria pakistanensis]
MNRSTDQIEDIPQKRSSTGVAGRILDGLAHLCIMISGALLVFLIVSFGWLVYGRYVLNNTPTWVEQSALLIVVYITCLGAAAGVRHNTHLSIDMVREALPAVPRAIMCHVADLFVLVFGVFMAWQGTNLVLDNMTRAIPMIGLSESWRAAPLAICGVLMVLFAGANIVERLTHTTRV